MNRESVQQILSGALENPGTVLRIEALEGDASTREYFRVIMEGGGDERIHAGSMILMRYPSSHVVDGELMFLNVHRYFSRAGIPVPSIYLHVPEAHLLFLEDAGDTTLEDMAGEKGFGTEVGRIYAHAMKQIVTIQVRGTQYLDERALPARHCFDLEKLMWEMDFLATWGLGRLNGSPRDGTLTSKFLGLAEPLVTWLTTLPLVLVHRDYHSRNIMVLPSGEIRILDFQDARMGNIYYDPASLIFDSYVTLPDSVRNELIELYMGKVGHEHFASFGSTDEFMDNLYTMAIQRNLKALGTFFYMYYGRGDDRYLGYILTTMDHLKKNPILKERYKRLSDFTMPLLESLVGQITRERGGAIEGNGPRRRPGNETSTADI